MKKPDREKGLTESTEPVEPYEGFEQGPIRPPSEAESLLIRVTRNCPWNKCAFCPVYKHRPFSRRPVEHVKRDIDMVHRHVESILTEVEHEGGLSRQRVREMLRVVPEAEQDACIAALNWVRNGMKSVFIQDANSLVLKSEALVEILRHLTAAFSQIQRITSYARSKTIARMDASELVLLREAGLNRIHIGMESGSDAVLKMIKKGATKAEHIDAGLKVKEAGIELSEYVMPGLGGHRLSDEHADETADAINRINPDFIRLRTLALPQRAPLFHEYDAGEFDKCTDVEVVAEIHRFIERLDAITSRLASDHILNLFQDLEGDFPDDKPKMLGLLRTFLDMPPEKQCRFQVGRRMGIFHTLADMESPQRMRKVKKICREHRITPENVDAVITDFMKRFV